MQSSFQVQVPGGSLDFHKGASAGAGESLVVVTCGDTMHLAHTLDVCWPRADYRRVPVDADDLNALIDACLNGQLDEAALRPEHLVPVGRRLGVMRTAQPPAYDIWLPPEWDDPGFYIAVGRRWPHLGGLAAPLVLWPQEWAAFRSGVMRICSVLSAAGLLRDPELAAA